MTGVAIVGHRVRLHHASPRAARRRVRRARARRPRSRRRPRNARARFDVPHACTTLADALALPGVDAVTIATPPHTHAPIALEAIAAGQARAVREAVRPRRRRGAPDARRGRARPASCTCSAPSSAGRRARHRRRASIARGEIGTPKLATFLLHIPMLADPAGEVPAWWGDAAEGGGWLGAQAAHVIDQMHDMLGEIEGVSASLTQVSARDWDVEDSYTVHFRTRSGVDGHDAEHRRRVGTADLLHPRRRHRRHGVAGVRHGARRRRVRHP